MILIFFCGILFIVVWFGIVCEGLIGLVVFGMLERDCVVLMVIVVEVLIELLVV